MHTYSIYYILTFSIGMGGIKTLYHDNHDNEHPNSRYYCDIS